MGLIMLQIKDIPDDKILEKFIERYPDAEAASVLPFLNILRVGSDLTDALNEFLAQYDLQQGRWWVLILLMREDTLTSTPSSLAEKAGVSRATMTGLIDGLEKEGLVKRLFDSTDRRKVVIKLTPAGQSRLDDVMPPYYRKVKRLMQALTVHQRKELVNYLGMLNANIDVLK